MANRVPFITASAIESLLNWERVTQLIENALFKFSERTSVSQPPRTRVEVAKHRGFLLTMPAYVEGDEHSSAALACKMVTVYPENKTEPTHQAHVILLDHRNGSVLATLDGEAITRIRTAATSAVATKYLGKASSKSLGIIGAGTEARSHLSAFTQLFPHLEKIFIWSRRHESCTQLVDEQTPAIKQRMVICSSAQELAKQCDIICTLTMATEPVLHGAHVKPGTHINSVGAPSPAWRELDEELVHKSEVYVDSRESAQKETGDIVVNKATIRAEIGELISSVRKGEYARTADAVTVFKSCGLAIEDAVAARYFYDQFTSQANSASSNV